MSKEDISKQDEFICNSGLSMHPFNVDDIQFKGTKVKELLMDYAKEEMIALIKGISSQPIQCYSEKVKGQDKQFYLGRSYVEDLIKRIRESK